MFVLGGLGQGDRAPRGIEHGITYPHLLIYQISNLVIHLDLFYIVYIDADLKAVFHIWHVDLQTDFPTLDADPKAVFLIVDADLKAVFQSLDADLKAVFHIVDADLNDVFEIWL